jgi:squalene-hopene/tetraprenyl-beta-curcumene cyclase
MYQANNVVSLNGRAPRAAASLDEGIEAASSALRRGRQADGHWLYELEADATIPAEYVLFTH